MAILKIKNCIFITVLIGAFWVSTSDVCTGTTKKENLDAKFNHNKRNVIAKTLCSLREEKFEVMLISPSGDELEDDTNIWFSHSAQVVNANPSNPGYIAFIPAISTTICTDVAAFEVPGNSVMVPFFLSNRPDLDFVAVAIYNPNTARVLKYSVLERYYGKMPTLRFIKDGFSYRAVSSQYDDSPTGLVESWLNVTWDGRNITKKWDASRGKVRH
jgi:hypothetical protein